MDRLKAEVVGMVQGPGWWDRHVAKEAGKDMMSFSERVGQMIGIAVALICALYFTSLYNSRSGFFTSGFTNADALLFFGIAYLGPIPGVVKAVMGRKNASRPLDVILSLAMLAAALLFLSSFPFDLSHLADALPRSLQFILSWVNDGIARMLMILAAVASIFIIPYTAALYLSVRRRLRQAAP